MTTITEIDPESVCLGIKLNRIATILSSQLDQAQSDIQVQDLNLALNDLYDIIELFGIELINNRG
jgi:hypothetical protein